MLDEEHLFGNILENGNRSTFEKVSLYLTARNSHYVPVLISQLSQWDIYYSQTTPHRTNYCAVKFNSHA